MNEAKLARVVVVGSTNFDVVVKAARMPKEGETMVASNLQFFAGGKGANQAVGAARLGAQTTMVSAVGQDSMGESLIQGLNANKVDTTWFKRDAAQRTGFAFIMVFPTGNNGIVVEPAANMSLTPADVERAAEAIAAADVVTTVMEIPLEAVEAALRLGRRAGKLTVLDAGPPQRCPAEILKLADVVSPNETELEALTGEEVSGRVSAEKAARKLLDLGVKTVVLKLGSDGSMLVTSEVTKHFPACRVTAVDPTAAGDALTAALAVQLGSGASLEAAIRYANCAGALTVTKLGAQPSLPTRAEVEAFIASHAASPLRN
jgi:ribokinase